MELKEASMSNIDLWPKDLITFRTDDRVESLLIEQARLLEEKTNCVLKGLVEFNEIFSHQSYKDLILSISFSILCPTIGVKKELFQVRSEYGKSYPCQIFSPDGNGLEKTANEEQFKEALKHIFAHPRTKALAQTLIYRVSEYERKSRTAKLMPFR